MLIRARYDDRLRSRARTVPNSILDKSLPGASGGDGRIECTPPAGEVPPAGGSRLGRAAVSGPGPKSRPLRRIAWPGLSSGCVFGFVAVHRTVPLSRSTTVSITGASTAPACNGVRANSSNIAQSRLTRVIGRFRYLRRILTYIVSTLCRSRLRGRATLRLRALRTVVVAAPPGSAHLARPVLPGSLQTDIRRQGAKAGMAPKQLPGHFVEQGDVPCCKVQLVAIDFTFCCSSRCAAVAFGS